MKKSLQDALTQARTCLENSEYNLGLEVLEEWPDHNPEVEHIRRGLEQARVRRIENILKDVEQCRRQKEWPMAFQLIREAQTLDDRDEKVRSSARRLRDDFAAERREEEVNKNKQAAKKLLDRSQRSREDLETAIRILEELISIHPGELDAESMLNDAQRQRTLFLKSIGEVATLEQAEQYQEALKKVNNLIARGLTEHEGQNVFDLRSRLERSSREHTENKAAKYLEKAEAALEKDNNPKLSLRYIDLGLSLPGISKDRRDAFSDLKIKVEQAAESLEEAEKHVRGAQEHLEKQDYRGAVSLLEKTLARFPGHTGARGYLDLARNGLKEQALQEARLAVARVETGLYRDDFQKSRRELMEAIHRLDFPGTGAEKLLEKCNLILQRLNNEEQQEILLKATVARARQALNRADLDNAQLEIESLDKELRKRPEVTSIRTALARKQGIEDALNQAKQAVDEGNFQSARKQVRVLKQRARDHEEVNRLHKEIKAAVTFQKSVEHFNKGLLKEARRGFKQVAALDSLHAEEAGSFLGQIDDLSDRDRGARKLYRAACKHNDALRYNHAYHTLAQIDDTPSSIKKDIDTLRTGVRRKWRTQLLKQIRVCLKKEAYDGILDLAKDLQEVRHAEDTPLINRVYKYHYIHQARLAEKQPNWNKAMECWQGAQKYDAADEDIHRGLLTAKKNKALRGAASMLDENEAVHALEEVLEQTDNPLTELDYKIDCRLYQAYLHTGMFGRAMALAALRLGTENPFAAKAQTVRELCRRLNQAKEQFQVGAFRESLDGLDACGEEFSQFEGIIQDLYLERKKNITETLLREARQMELGGETGVTLLAKYGEVLQFQPGHREAAQKHETLRNRFQQDISETIREAVALREDENASIEAIDILIEQIRQLMGMANSNQQTKLNPHLEHLLSKRQNARLIAKKINRIEAFLTEATESGDFHDVDRELNDIVHIASQRNQAYGKLVLRIRRTKESRKVCEEKARQLETAFKKQDFAAVETLAAELKRLDPDDGFYFQRDRLCLEDPFSNQAVLFSQLKEWASLRRQNTEKLQGWFKLNFVDTAALETEEAQLRSNFQAGFDHLQLAHGLQKLAKSHRDAAQPLAVRPEAPVCRAARDIVDRAETLIKELAETARKLEEEARQIFDNHQKIVELEEAASNCINKKDFAHAKILIEKGLKIHPTHKVLRHFKEMVDNELR